VKAECAFACFSFLVGYYISEVTELVHALSHFTFWISPFAQRIRYVYSQASRSNYRGYLHVLKYLIFIIIILKQEGVMQMNRLADV